MSASPRRPGRFQNLVYVLYAVKHVIRLALFGRGVNIRERCLSRQHAHGDHSGVFRGQYIRIQPVAYHRHLVRGQSVFVHAHLYHAGIGLARHEGRSASRCPLEQQHERAGVGHRMTGPHRAHHIGVRCPEFHAVGITGLHCQIKLNGIEMSSKPTMVKNGDKISIFSTGKGTDIVSFTIEVL